MAIFRENRALLLAFRRGEASALETVYQYYIDEILRLGRFGFSVYKSGQTFVIPGVAAVQRDLDLAQDVFMKAFSDKARAAYDGVRPYGAYLMTIARNTLIDIARQNGREIYLDDFMDVEANVSTLLPTVDPKPEDNLHWNRLRKATHDYLETQSEEMQEFVRLRFMEEMSQPKVMQKMALSRRRARTLERKSQEGLGRFLKAHKLTWEGSAQ